LFHHTITPQTNLEHTRSGNVTRRDSGVNRAAEGGHVIKEKRLRFAQVCDEAAEELALERLQGGTARLKE
jgi:hypothetical protein